jgi:hypothetical protein
MMTRARRRAVRGFGAAGAVALAVFALSWCSSAPNLKTELQAAVAGSSDAPFRLSSLDAAKGSNFLVVCPYESTASVEERLGFEWNDAPDYSDADDLQAIIEVEGDDVVSRTEFRRDEIDFCAGDDWELIPVDTALALSGSDGVTLVSVA